MFDSIDLMKGTIVDNTFDFAADKKLHVLRTYSGYTSKKYKPFGTFSHNFDETINPKITYKKEYIASKIKHSPKNAYESGWHDMAGDVYLGKLKDLDAVFEAKSNLCNVYDEYGNLKTTLLVKNKKTHKR